MTVLDRILATKRDEITVLHRPQTRALLRGQALDAPPTRAFADALRRDDGHPGLVAEIKRRSPSKGDLAPDLDAAILAKEYAAGGATALSVLAGLADGLGLGVLVEAHDVDEVDRAVTLRATIVGVNARDLGTFTEDLDGAAALAAHLPPATIAVAESAIRTPADAAHMAASGFDALLVGEALVRAADPRALATSLVAPSVVARS